MKSEWNRRMLDPKYRLVRLEYANAMRLEGRPFREVGMAVGVTARGASNLVRKFRWIQRSREHWYVEKGAPSVKEMLYARGLVRNLKAFLDADQ